MRTGLISKVSTHLIKIAAEVVVGKRDNLVINGNDYDTPDGTPVRDYIHVSDLADVHVIAMKHLLSGGNSDTFNCGYGKGYSVNQVLDHLNEILPSKIRYTFGPRRQGDSKMIVSNVDKFRDKFSWEPKFYNLKIILDTAVEWEKKINSK